MHSEDSRSIFLVMPTLNSEEFIEEALRSVINQQGDFYLYLHIQDGGSADNTLNIVHDFIASSANTKNLSISLDSRSDSGMYDAIHKGFSALSIPSDSPIGWLNSDDILLPGCLADTANVFSAFNELLWLGSCYPWAFNEDGSTVTVRKCYFPQDFIRNGLADGTHWPFLQQEGIFFRKLLYDKVEGVNPNLKLAGDWHLWVKFAQQTPFYQMEAPRAVFRVVKNQLSSNVLGYQDEINSIVSVDERNKRAQQNLDVFNLRSYIIHNSSEAGYKIFDAHIEDAFPRDWMWSTLGQKVQEKKNNIDKQLIDANHKIKDFSAINNKLEHALRHSYCAQNSFTNRLIWNNNHLHFLYNKMPKVVQKLLTKVKYRFAFRLLDAPRILRSFLIIHSSALFWSEYYLNQNPDVARLYKRSPLTHFILHGANEFRNPNPFFDVKYYLNQNPDVACSNMNPLVHYIMNGHSEGRPINPYFQIDR